MVLRVKEGECVSEFYMLPIRCWGGVLMNTAINLRVPHKWEFLDLQFVYQLRRRPCTTELPA